MDLRGLIKGVIMGIVDKAKRSKIEKQAESKEKRQLFDESCGQFDKCDT